MTDTRWPRKAGRGLGAERCGSGDPRLWRLSVYTLRCGRRRDRGKDSGMWSQEDKERFAWLWHSRRMWWGQKEARKKEAGRVTMGTFSVTQRLSQCLKKGEGDCGFLEWYLQKQVRKTDKKTSIELSAMGMSCLPVYRGEVGTHACASTWQNLLGQPQGRNS